MVIFVLGIGLIGALSFFNININNQFEAKNELIAAGLAQESSDLMRNIVDHSYLNGQLWYDEITKKNAPNIKTEYCSSIDRDVLYGDNFKCRTKPKKPEKVCFDPANGVYSQAKNCPGDQITTDFTRNLTIGGVDMDSSGIIDLDTGDCISVVVSVAWNGRETKSTDIICKPRQ